MDGGEPVIASCGEALVDFVPATSGAQDRAGTASWFELLGGSPYNVARGLGRLGAPSAFVGAISTDFFGDELVGGLEQSAVSAEHVARLERPSTLSFVRLDGGGPSYAFFSAESADRHFALDDPKATASAFEALHFGSNSLVLEPGASEFESLAAAASAQRRLVSLDPNVRPRLVPDRDDYLRRLDRLVALADLVKMSDEDVDWIAPDSGAERTAERMLQEGAVLVVVTSGRAGAAAWTRTSEAAVTAPIVEVLDTIGAGDGFTAALLSFLHERGHLTRGEIEALSETELEELLTFAAAVAATVCTRRGADMPTRREVEALGLLPPAGSQALD